MDSRLLFSLTRSKHTLEGGKKRSFGHIRSDFGGFHAVSSLQIPTVVSVSLRLRVTLATYTHPDLAANYTQLSKT